MSKMEIELNDEHYQFICASAKIQKVTPEALLAKIIENYLQTLVTSLFSQLALETIKTAIAKYQT